jgi:hypothetical protein
MRNPPLLTWCHCEGASRVLTVDRPAASPSAVEALRQAGQRPEGCRLRQHLYVNHPWSRRIAW